jgi:hypothetical protein
MIAAQVNRTVYLHRPRTWFLSCRRTTAARWHLLTVISVLLACTFVHAQSTASIEGQITDQKGAVIPNVEITATSRAIAVERSTLTDDAGRYQIPSLPVGDYRIEVKASGFQTQILESIRVEVARRITEDFQLRVGEASEQVTISSSNGALDLANVSVGHMIDRRTVQEIPLNGRHFIDLGLLVPGSVTPPQNGNLSAPTRGQGSQAMNTAGSREDTVNFQINGINFNDLINNIITMLPPISSIQEFAIDNSTFSAEYGRNSGAIVNLATRSGTNQYHGELIEFFRNDALDARNFFDFNSSKAQPFKRNQFGGSLGGPLVLPGFGEGDAPFAYYGKDRTFFFFAYEGLRQNQAVSLNTVVLSDQQRLSVTDPVIKKLIDLIPRANFIDSSGAARFVGVTPTKVLVDQWSIDISHNLNQSDRLHGYYAVQRDDRNEPTLLGNNIPGFGDIRKNLKQIFTLNLTQVFNNTNVNEARFGFNRFSFRGSARFELNSADFQIMNGINQAIGLPQINVAGAFNFGGPRQVPQGRGDTSFVASDTLSRLTGSHSLKLGGEYRRFFSNFFMTDVGQFNFPSIGSFISGNANAFSITLPGPASSIAQTALDLFILDNYKWKSNLTLDLGFRYELNVAPTERFNRFIVFDPERASLVRVGTDIDQVYKSNAANFQPRVGLAWDPFKDGKTSLRAAYAVMTEQPTITAVLNTTTNPPLATPLTFTGTVRFDNARALATSAGVAPITIDHNYDNSYVQTWNLNVQRELMRRVVLMAGYFGSKGTHLRISRNINQPVNGVRPFAQLSASSPVLPGAPLGNITQVEGTGNSSYNAFWLSGNVRSDRGLQLNASYSWSKSIDYNSLTSPITVTVQDSYNLRGDRGLSDFDARHRLTLYGIYELPFKQNRVVGGWQLAAIVQVQTGNPVNIITSNATVNGVVNTLRPDVNDPVQVIGSVDRWFDTSVFTAVPRFGNLGRNVVIGPGFSNVDLSLVKDTKLSEDVTLQFRVEAFDFFNHASFGQPGRVVGTPAFGRISNTRFPTGDSGSSRQLQFAVKLMF